MTESNYNRIDSVNRISKSPKVLDGVKKKKTKYNIVSQSRIIIDYFARYETKLQRIRQIPN